MEAVLLYVGVVAAGTRGVFGCMRTAALLGAARDAGSLPRCRDTANSPFVCVGCACRYAEVWPDPWGIALKRDGDTVLAARVEPSVDPPSAEDYVPDNWAEVWRKRYDGYMRPPCPVLRDRPTATDSAEGMVLFTFRKFDSAMGHDALSLIGHAHLSVTTTVEMVRCPSSTLPHRVAV